METSIVKSNGNGQIARAEEVDQIGRNIALIQIAAKSVMKADAHYGIIPGTVKPTLLKPGAEILSLLFGLRTRFRVDTNYLPDGHREITVYATTENRNGEFVGEGVGSCSTLESKYRWRKSERTCPACGQAAIIVSTDFRTKEKNGLLCFAKKGGCGAKYEIGTPEHDEILQQPVGRMENPDIADLYNTVLKMAKKRAHIDSVITSTGASDFFSQDLEDLPPEYLPKQKPVDAASVKEPAGPEPMVNPWAWQLQIPSPKLNGKYLFQLTPDQLTWILTPANQKKLLAEDRVNVKAAEKTIADGSNVTLIEDARSFLDPVASADRDDVDHDPEFDQEFRREYGDHKR